jgi:flavin-dependent dehydrogenase
MSMTRTFDVLVAGAGPAGSIAATELAKSGLDVGLLDARSETAAIDLLLVGTGQEILRTHDVALAAARPMDVMELRFGERPGRTFDELDALVVDAGALRAALVDAATAAGATLLTGTAYAIDRTDGGLRVTVATDEPPITVKQVVIATGTSSTSLAARPVHTGAGLSCAQRFAGIDGLDRIVLALIPPRSTRADAPPISAWALPGRDGLCTVGVACVENQEDLEPAELLARALRALADVDPAFTGATAAARRCSGSLDTGFSPERVLAAPGLLIGDAAGLVNPFTGEGLSYALESGLLAAEAILANPGEPEVARRRYAHKLSSAFVGYFETSRHASRRYHLAWRILAAAAEHDTPFFAKGRRAVVLPAGIGGLTAYQSMSVHGPDVAAIGPFLLACDEVMVATIRRDWPFLARLTSAGDGFLHHRIRPALLFAAALVAGGRRIDPAMAPLAAAIELTSLGALAFLGGSPPDPRPARGVDWAVTGVVLAGDFLLAQASRIVAETVPEACWSFAEWLAELTTLRAARLEVSPATSADAPFAALFEFPARLGGQLGGATPDDIESLRTFGAECGNAFLHAEDILALRGERTRLDSTLDAMKRSRNSNVPADISTRSRTLAEDRWSAAHDQAVHDCQAAQQSALAAAAHLPGSVAVRLLSQLVQAVAAPCTAPAASRR